MSTTALETLVSNMALSELAQLSGRSIAEIVNWAMSGVRAEASRSSAGARPEATRTRATSTPAPSSNRSARREEEEEVEEVEDGEEEVNTRTQEGRERYDRAVLELVRNAKGPIGATQIRDALGGTPLQVRTALNRLIEGGHLAYQGRARATRYRAR